MSNVTSSANPDQEVAAAIEASQQCGDEQCTCAAPCRCLPYEFHLKVVTRLGGIPVKGISCVQEAKTSDAGHVLDSGVYFGRSDEDGNYSKIKLNKKKLELTLTYANEAEKLRTETVSVTINGLTPTCTDKSALKAQFKHQIEKIRDVLGNPTEEEIQTAMRNDTAADMDCHFIDEYILDVTPLKAETTDTNTSPVPPNPLPAISDIAVQSKLSIVPATNDELMQVYLSVSLATFNLKVPYMSQVGSHVKLATEEVSKDKPDIGVRAWSPVSVSGTAPNATEPESATTSAKTATPAPEVKIKESVGREHIEAGFKYENQNPWHGERLCSPTSSAMIMKYYGLSDVGNIQTRADIMAAYINRPNCNADRNGKESGYCSWEVWGYVPQAWKYIVETALASQALPNFNTRAVELDTNANVSASLEHFLPYTSYGHALQVRIKGGHVAVLIGVVLDHEAQNLWAICHDPYGTLAGPESDYSRITKESYYEGTGSSTRKGRNDNPYAPGVIGDIHEKGRHVYYNDETHTRGDSRDGDSGTGGLLEMSLYAYMTYRHPNDAAMLTKNFVAQKLVHGAE